MLTSQLIERCGTNRFRILLILLVGIHLVPAVLEEQGFSVPWFELLLSLTLFAAVLAFCLERHQRIFALLLVPLTVLCFIAAAGLEGKAQRLAVNLGYLGAVLFLFGSAWSTVKMLYRDRHPSADSLFGAACGYLFLGQGWAVIYRMIETMNPGSFDFGESSVLSDRLIESSQVLTYYSFATLTTLGYGDIAPVSATARTFSWLEAATGQFYLAVVVAGLVSLLLARQGRRPQEDLAGEA